MVRLEDFVFKQLLPLGKFLGLIVEEDLLQMAGDFLVKGAEGLNVGVGVSLQRHHFCGF